MLVIPRRLLPLLFEGVGFPLFRAPPRGDLLFSPPGLLTPRPPLSSSASMVNPPPVSLGPGAQPPNKSFPSRKEIYLPSPIPNPSKLLISAQRTFLSKNPNLSVNGPFLLQSTPAFTQVPEDHMFIPVK